MTKELKYKNWQFLNAIVCLISHWWNCSNSNFAWESIYLKCEFLIRILWTIPYSIILPGLRQHKKSKHEDVRHPCDQCTHVSTSIGNLKQHKQIKHDGIKFLCDQCEYSTTKQFYLKEHRLNVHEGVRYPCDMCDYSATRISFLKRHKQSKHQGLRFKCDLCDYTATRKDKLKGHMNKKHNYTWFSLFKPKILFLCIFSS